MTDILTMHQACFEAIGGDTSEAVRTYYVQKNTSLTRAEFFDRAIWAILVAGIKRTVADKLKERAESCSFPSDWEQVAQWNKLQFDQFIDCIRRNRGGSVRKWGAIRYIAQWLAELGSDEALQKTVFDRKTVGAELGGEDVARLLHLRLPFIGPANSQYIVKMFGSETIKYDVWVDAFCTWKNWTLDELNQEVDKARIPRGFWDTVLWQYCETYVIQTRNLPPHFNEKFAPHANP